MNYKDLIEKVAAEAMPIKTPSGQWAVPRGYTSPSATREQLNEMIDEWNYGYENGKGPYKPIPENLTPFADDEMGNTLLHDESGKVFSFNDEEGEVYELGKNVLDKIYTPHDINEHDLAKARAIPERELNILSYGKRPLEQYKQYGLYNPNNAGKDRLGAVKKSVSNLPKTLAASAMVGLVGASKAYERTGNMSGAKKGAIIGSAIPLAIGTAAAVNNFSKAPVKKAKQNARYLRNLKQQGDENEDFLSQYR